MNLNCQRRLRGGSNVDATSVNLQRPTNLTLLGEIINSKNGNRSPKPDIGENNVDDENAEVDELDWEVTDSCRICGLEHFAEDVPDNRLKNWESILQDRERIANKIKRATGRNNADLLFNRAVSVDYRDKILMQRMLGHAERMDPETHLKDIINRGIRMNMSVLQYPKRYAPIVRRCTAFEVSGIPKIIKKELIGDYEPKKTAKWFKLDSVQQDLKQKKNKIKNVVEFFPDIDNLQVIGVAIPKPVIEDSPEDLSEKCKKPSTKSIHEYIKQFKREAEDYKRQIRARALASCAPSAPIPIPNPCHIQLPGPPPCCTGIGFNRC